MKEVRENELPGLTLRDSRALPEHLSCVTSRVQLISPFFMRVPKIPVFHQLVPSSVLSGVALGKFYQWHQDDVGCDGSGHSACHHGERRRLYEKTCPENRFESLLG